MKTIKTTLVMGTALLCKMLAGLVAVKLCAQFVGIGDFGLTGQISSLIAIVTLLASGGVAVGLAKVRSDSEADSAALSHWIAAGRVLSLSASVLLVVCFIIGQSYIEEVVLGDSAYARAIFLAVLFSIVPIGLCGIPQGLINGGQNSGLYARSLIFGSIAGVAGFLLLSMIWDAKGALLGIIWLPIAQALAVILLGSKLCPENPAARQISVSRKEVGYLGKFGLLSITAGTTIPLAYIFVRLLVQRYAGLENLGLWQATVRLSEAYTQLPMLMLSVVFFSRFASKSKREIDWSEVRKAYLFVIILMLAIGVFVYGARPYLVRLLFTKEFSGVADLVLWQVSGDLLRMLSYVGTTILAARGFVKLCIFAEVLQGALFCLASLAIVPNFGTLGPFIAYMATYGIYLLFSIFALLYLQSDFRYKYATLNR